MPDIPDIPHMKKRAMNNPAEGGDRRRNGIRRRRSAVPNPNAPWILDINPFNSTVNKKQKKAIDKQM